ncbi:MAG: hypothetical protein CMJ86_04790, partial [Planctomycetes bacterium]|nr:hypothetical protein [Planctomycetota bacterium]
MTLADVEVESIVSSSDDEIVVVAAASEAGIGDVVVTADTGAVISDADAWTYTEASNITGVLPDNGQRGTIVTIKGTRLRGGGSTVVTVTLSGVEAGIESESDTVVVVTADAGDAGIGHVVVVADSGASATLENGWTYNVAGEITLVSPSVGQLNTLVTVRGTSLLGGGEEFVNVTLAGVEAVVEEGLVNGSVVVRAASGSAGDGDVRLLSDTGAIVELVGGWTYSDDGAITAVEPTSGQEGTRVTITGERLRGAGNSVESVTLGGTSATIESQSDDEVRVVAGVANASAGAVAVVLTADTGATVSEGDGWTYLTAGNVDSVSPSSGQVGTEIEISGTNLLGGGSTIVSVTLDGVDVESIDDEQSDTRIVVVAAGSSSAGSTDVVLTADSGAIIRGGGLWTYLTEGVVELVVPESGQGGTRVVVNGTSLRGGGSEIVSVSLGGVNASIVSESDDEVAVVAGESSEAGVGDVILVADSGAIVTSADAWTYLTAGEIESLTPARGQVGVFVTISGSGLFGGGTEVVEVTLDGVSVTDLAVEAQDETRLVVRAGGSEAGTGDVVVKSDTGAVITLEDGWEYETASAITDVVPSAGQVGTIVTISGSLLLGNDPAEGSTITSVTFAGVSGTVLGASATEVTVAAASGTAGTGDVILTATSGALTVDEDGWTYNEVGVIDEVLPGSGQVGTYVTLRGERLLGGGDEATSVTLSESDATVVDSSATEVTIRAGVGDISTGDVVIVSDSGAIVTLGDGWTYVNASGILTVEPVSGQHGTVVTIRGFRLQGNGSEVVEVNLAGVGAEISSESDEVVEVVAGLQGSGLTGDVLIVADNGATTTLVDGWTYNSPGVVDELSPTSGRFGTRVLISGSSLRGGGSEVTSVTLGGNAATITAENDTHVNVAAGVGPDDETVVDVRLVANSGAIVTKADAWTYVASGSVLVVDPSSGQQDTVVSIAGQDLCGGGSEIESVTLIGVEAEIESGGCSLVRVTAAEFGANAVGDIVLTADSGAKVVEEDGWTYFADGNVTSVSPNAGQSGSLVTIQGSTLFGGGTSAVSVSLAGVPGVILDPVGNETYIVVRVNEGPTSREEAVGDVVITGNTGIVVRSLDAWTYSVVDRVTPSSGQGGTVVVIEGVGLLAGGAVDTVTLADVEVESVEFANSTSIGVVASVLDTGSDESGVVAITMDNGQEVLSVAGEVEFTYKVPGEIVSVEPSIGQFGTFVTISGTNLLGYGTSLTSVTLAGVDVDDIVEANVTFVKVIAGASGAVGAGEVVLTADTGAVVSVSEAFEYNAPGEISGASPSEGQVGTRVTIAGTGLLSGASELLSATLSGVSVETIESAEATLVVVKAGASSSTGAGDIVLTSVNGARVTGVNAWNYTETGVIETVSPSSGQVGTDVVIVGERLRGNGGEVVSVELAGEEATIVSENDTVVEVIATSGSSGAGDVLLVADSGARVTLQTGWTYITAGAISEVVPNSGQFETLVTISGTTLLGGGSAVSSLTLNDIEHVGSVDAVSNSEIVLSVLSGSAGSGDVVITSDTGAEVRLADGWTHLADGDIDEVDPSSGQFNTRVVIRGSRLLGGGTDIASVSLAGIAATYVAGTGNDTRVDVVVGAGGDAGTTGDVVLTADSGAVVTSSDAWTYVAGGNITGVAPSSGQEGTRVTISGTDLLGGGAEIVGVTLGGVDVDTVSAGESDTTIVVVAGASNTAFTGDVVLTADSGATTTRSDIFTYLAVPAIASVNPSEGQIGTVVTIRGANLLSGGTEHTEVQLKDVEASSISETSDSTVIVVAASGDAGTGDVLLISDTGSIVTLTDGWEYFEGGVIDDVTPGSGQTGSLVVITGERLLGGGESVGSVTLAGETVESIEGANDTVVTVVASGSGSAKVGDVVVQADTGATVTSEDAWAYLAPGNITSVTPGSGQYGTRVTIVGNRLLGDGDAVASVTLAGVEAEISNSNATHVEVVAAASGAISGDVVVVSDTGIIVETSGAWEYKSVGFIASADPNQGVEGTTTTIYGSDLRGHGSEVISVTLAGVAADIVVETNFFVRVVAGAGDAGESGDIVFVSDSGAVVSKSDAWTYVAEANITGVSPEAGASGIVVIINGTNLLSGAEEITSVTLAGVAATIVEASDTGIVVVAGLVPDGTEVTGDVVVTTNTGVDAVLSDAWSYTELGEIHSVSPSSGQVGTRVSITGTSLRAGGNAVSSVTLADVEVATIVSESNELVIVDAGASDARTGDIVITADSGARILRL